MNNKPLISIIMGVYNVSDESVLQKAVSSILDQTYGNFEFIICDDGSSDNTLEMIKKIGKTDKRIKIIKNEKNCGLSYTLNHCLKYAKGNYIARMDADDF